ncbi:MAG: hypothetical protein JW940_37975, partial [Polyangiaceae bacterium]|nr:hypothetical protein [Polyangiaceae bacterium]
MKHRRATHAATRPDCTVRRLGTLAEHEPVDTTRALRASTAALICLLAACSAGDASTTPQQQQPPIVVPGGVAPGGLAGSSAAPEAAAAAGASGSLASPGPVARAGSGSPGRAPEAGAPGPDQPAAQVMPCNVAQALASNCQNCHGTTPIGGAPMAMMTYADLHKPAPGQPAMKVYQLAKVRMHDTMRPMPPIGVPPAADVAVLDSWFDGGALPGTAPEDAACVTTPSKPGTAEGSVDGSTGELVPKPGEQCFEFKTHNSTTSVDEAPYEVGGDGEHYEQFYFDVPWPADSVATSYSTKSDNAQVLHHWLLFSTDEKEVHGF